MVVVGPCSIHDPKSAMEYAERLARLAGQVSDQLFLIMRVYFEKPRTTVGWKGLINDPDMNGTHLISKGLGVARGLLCKMTELKLPVATEMLDPITPEYLADMLCWGAIGARTTESQTHRELASGLSFPIGFKNGTDGNLQIAIDAMIAALHPHSFLGINREGLTSIIQTTGNPDVHIVLRGEARSPTTTRKTSRRPRRCWQRTTSSRPSWSIAATATRRRTTRSSRSSWKASSTRSSRGTAPSPG